MRRLLVPTLLATLIVSTVACGDRADGRSAGDGDGGGDWAGSIDTLESGRILVRNPILPSGRQPTDPARSGCSASVGWMDRSEAGEIMVLDGQAAQIRIFDGEGCHLRNFGRQGRVRAS